jgi:hypothetical protein
MITSVIKKVVEELESLPENLQREVLDFVHMLKSKQGVPGIDLLRFAGAIPADDLELMRRAIESDCEQVQADEW